MKRTILLIALFAIVAGIAAAVAGRDAVNCCPQGHYPLVPLLRRADQAGMKLACALALGSRKARRPVIKHETISCRHNERRLRCHWRIELRRSGSINSL
jgi:hypothetical protein